MDIVVAGETVKVQVSCGCGKHNQSIDIGRVCTSCDTKVLYVVTMRNIETADTGKLDRDDTLFVGGGQHFDTLRQRFEDTPEYVRLS